MCGAVIAGCHSAPKNKRPRGQHRSGLLVIGIIIQRIYARLQTYSGENLTLPSFKLLNIIRNKDSFEFMDVIISQIQGVINILGEDVI